MTESLKTVKVIMQELLDNFTQLAGEAEKRRKSASEKFEYYKFEFADGEKRANENAAKKIKTVLDEI